MLQRLLNYLATDPLNILSDLLAFYVVFMVLFIYFSSPVGWKPALFIGSYSSLSSNSIYGFRIPGKLFIVDHGELLDKPMYSWVLVKFTEGKPSGFKPMFPWMDPIKRSIYQREASAFKSKGDALHHNVVYLDKGSFRVRTYAKESGWVGTGDFSAANLIGEELAFILGRKKNQISYISDSAKDLEPYR